VVIEHKQTIYVKVTTMKFKSLDFQIVNNFVIFKCLLAQSPFPWREQVV